MGRSVPAEMCGGLCVIADRGVQAELPLPVAGPGPLVGCALSGGGGGVTGVREGGGGLGCTFGAVSDEELLALSGIPKLKITDRGLIDVDEVEIVPLAED
jgi:adenine deaminase